MFIGSRNFFYNFKMSWNLISPQSRSFIHNGSMIMMAHLQNILIRVKINQLVLDK